MLIIADIIITPSSPTPLLLSASPGCHAAAMPNTLLMLMLPEAWRYMLMLRAVRKMRRLKSKTRCLRAARRTICAVLIFFFFLMISFHFAFGDVSPPPLSSPLSFLLRRCCCPAADLSRQLPPAQEVEPPALLPCCLTRAPPMISPPHIPRRPMSRHEHAAYRQRPRR